MCQTPNQEALIRVPSFGGNDFGIIPPNCVVQFGKHVPAKLSFLFYKEILLFNAPLNPYQTVTFAFSYIYMFAVFARDGINRVGPFLPRSLVKGEDMRRLITMLCISSQPKGPA